VTPNQSVNLPASYGSGARVVLRETVRVVITPASGQVSGGKYVMDETVNMIHVIIPSQNIDIVVAHAQAHADFPQTTMCAAQRAAVSGHAFLVSTNVASLAGTTTDYVDIPATGATQTATINDASVPGVVTAGSGQTSSTGTVGSPSTASSYATLSNVNILGGAVKATVIKSQSNSYAGTGGSESDPAGSQLVNITVNGSPISDNPAPNTTVNIPGVGFVIFNEQIIEGPTANNNTHTGLTVRAIHVVVNALSGVVPGSSVIVAEAHSDAQV
jgi:hypothetical protein